MSRSMIALLGGATLCLFLVTSAAQAKVFQFKENHEYAVEKNFKLTVSNPTGSIRVAYRAGDKLAIEVTKEISASSREDAEEIENRIEVDIKAKNDAVEINTHNPFDRTTLGFWERLFGRHGDFSESVNYIIEVPTTLKLEISTTSGNISLLGLAGEGTISATSGDIKILSFTGDLNIETTSGNISFKEVKGDIDANSTSSDMLFDDVTGDVVVQSTSGETEAHFVVGNTRIVKTSGDVRIEGASGDIDINTTSGNIDIGQREGGIVVSSSSGDVRVRSEVFNGKRFEIETISGNITLEVPAEMRGRVRLETVSGSINTDLAVEVRSFDKHKLEGRIGGEGPDVILNSTSGDISLEGF